MACDVTDLRVWQDAIVLAEEISGVTRAFLPDERFGLTTHLRRASVSIVSCIAEGNARSSTRDDLRFLSMSSGSLAEVETQLLLAQRRGYVSDDAIALLLAPLPGVARQLQALKKALSTKLAARRMFPVPHSPFPAS